MKVNSQYDAAPILCLSKWSYEQNIALTWLPEGIFMEAGWLHLSSQCPEYEKLRLPISPSYLCSIWYEIWDECSSRKDARSSSGCWPDHGASLAKALQSCSLVILQPNPWTPRTQPAPSDRGTQKSSLTLLLLLPGCFEACGSSVKRVYDEKAEQKPISTGAFWEEQHVSIVLPAAEITGFS